MESALTRRRDGFSLAGTIRLDYPTGKLMIGDRDLALLIQVAQRDVVVETAGGDERTPTSCRVSITFEA